MPGFATCTGLADGHERSKLQLSQGHSIQHLCSARGTGFGSKDKSGENIVVTA